ncbi:hypothetical protein M426DRAFT_13991 [Hypoxylon sp. CI-4A]|nr:hypothetical protein M426DRAFT_13991 [Hypoxylon sp. CI-4A]
MELYTYRPLASGCIRVILLHPSEDNTAPLHCELEDINFKTYDFPPYDAISYTWGNQSPSEPLHVHSGPNSQAGFLDTSSANASRLLSITPNLALALKCFRPSGRPPRRLWADAVCIDQGNSSEKASQIAIMADVYRVRSDASASVARCCKARREGCEQGASCYSMAALQGAGLALSSTKFQECNAEFNPDAMVYTALDHTGGRAECRRHACLWVRRGSMAKTPDTYWGLVPGTWVGDGGGRA